MGTHVLPLCFMRHSPICCAPASPPPSLPFLRYTYVVSSAKPSSSERQGAVAAEPAGPGETERLLRDEEEHGQMPGMEMAKSRGSRTSEGSNSSQQ